MAITAAPCVRGLRTSIAPRRRATFRQALLETGDALDVGADRAQPLVDPLVAAVDLADVSDRRRAVGAEARDQHRHSRADVRALHPFAVEPRGAGDDRAVRVAEDDA